MLIAARLVLSASPPLVAAQHSGRPMRRQLLRPRHSQGCYASGAVEPAGSEAMLQCNMAIGRGNGRRSSIDPMKNRSMKGRTL
ncbi:MAG TPA: hypothetical protein VD995_04390 [Azospirillum sp.]|nr:hypothetical protein [Azospirillum sp.]